MSLNQAINMRVTGLLALQVKLKKLEIIPRLAVTVVIAKYAVKIQSAARKLVRVDQGFTRSSILTLFMNKGLTASIGSDQAAATYIEGGTKPHWAPRGALLPWVRRHGMPDSAEYLVRRAIAKRGTRARPFLKPAWDEWAPSYVEEATAEIQKNMDPLIIG